MTTFLRLAILTAAAVSMPADIPRVSLSQSLASTDISQSSVSSPWKQAGSKTDTPPPDGQSQKPGPGEDEDSLAKDREASEIAGDLSKPIDADMKVQIIRYIDGEFGKASKPIPGKLSGFTIKVGQPIDGQAYQDALRLQGTAISEGDPVQVTRVDFTAQKIILQVNGGAKKKFHLMDHLQIGVGGTGTAPVDDSGASGDRHPTEGHGAVIVLDYGKSVPDVSPSDIKQELSPLIDFTKQHSAAQNWVQTLSPAFQNAIKDHKALPGMDAQTVIAAIGRPDKKVREKNSDGIETEDWIYGNPPARTTFVTFVGEKVTTVEECGGPQTQSDTSTTCNRMR